MRRITGSDRRGRRGGPDLLPTFLIVGAAKAGTTSLYEYLRPHPQVFMAQPKELNFFSYDRRWAWGPGWYERHFQGADGAIAVGEASPSYTQFTRRVRALPRIGELLSDVRLIFLARHPISRARSSYGQLVSEGKDPRPIAAALVEGSEYIEQSMYWLTTQDLLRVVDRDRLLINRTEALRGDPGGTLDRVHRFLGVEPRDDPIFRTEFNRGADRPRVKRRLILGVSESRSIVRLGEAMPEWTKPVLHRLTRRPPTRVREDLDPESAARLIEYLRPDVRAFGQFLGEDLSAWETWPDPNEARGAGPSR